MGLAGVAVSSPGARADDLSAFKAPVADSATTIGGQRSAKAKDDGTAAPIVEPELPPESDEAPPLISRAQDDVTPPAAATKSEPTAGAAASLAENNSTLVDGAPQARSDPEAPVPSLGFAGASPADVAAAIDALSSADSRKNSNLGLGDRQAARDAIEGFYASRGDMPKWTDAKGFTAAGRAILARLARAGEDGLDLTGLPIPDPAERIEAPERLARAEVGLAEAIVVYAFQASGGRIDPIRISALITAKPEIVEPARALETIAEASDPDAALGSFNPPQKGYRDLRERLAELRAAYPSLDVKAGRAADERAPLIRSRFDRASNEAEAIPRPRMRLAAASIERSSVAPTVPLDPSVEQALSGRGPCALEAAILANMEMWRWEPRDMGAERLEVNVADFSLRVLQGDETVHRARIIVGKPDTQTPIFSNTMRYILVNPSWSVPTSIVRKEMLPKLAEDPDYLTRLGYEVTQHGDMISVKQPPGEKNALGRIAFMFPNEHSVYLHDTPARGLFASARRAFSHGCVRVDQPMRLAEIVMGAGWSEERFRALIGGAERTVFLPRPLPIHIEYFTTFVDGDGDLQMRDDLYGHTGRVESALGLSTRG
jgi:murein L,D-transpeptidase YcbB/YkuD